MELNHAKLDNATDRMSDLFGELNLSAEEGLLVLIRLAATTTAYDIYTAQRAITRINRDQFIAIKMTRTNDATDLVVELFRKYVNIAYDNLMLEGEPPAETAGH